jgi:lipopolysaccharide transport system ATP-binding protein
MSDLAIRVESLGKRYRIGQREPYKALRDVLAQASLAPYRWLRSQFGSRNGKYQDDGYIWALRDVSFEVERGEVIGIIGRNGAGKSTLLKILSRITKPTKGYAEICGRVGSLLEVGTGFHPELTGRENIYLNGAILGMKRAEIERKFDEIVDFAEIEKFLDTPVKRYSSGMYVRLAFAVAAHLDPEILLIDEVLAVGDARFQKKCLNKIGNVARAGRTVLFVSHNMSAIQALCQRGILLRFGEIYDEGPIDEVVQSYLQEGFEIQSSDLAHRMDREGSNVVKVCRVRFIDGINHQDLQVLISGRSVIIEVEYEKRVPEIIKSFDISIGFFTQLGTLLFACRSSAIGSMFQIEDRGGNLYCKIPKWPLSSGIYTFNIYSKANGTICDWVKEAGTIVVENGDYYGTGKLPAQTKQSVFVDYSWRDRL